MARKYPISKRYEAKDLGGEVISFIVVSDLEDEEIIQQIDYYLDAEDYEYCEILALEAAVRGISIKESILKALNK